MSEVAPGPLGRQTARRYWVAAFLGFFLMVGAWAIAAPYDGSPDEAEHIIRAVGVVSGEVAPAPAAAVRGSGAFQTVPTAFSPVENCWRRNVMVPAACGIEPNGDRTPVTVPTGAGRYPPLFYALVGLPMLAWPTIGGVILARLISSALIAALLAGALVCVVGYSRRRFMLAGLLVATTPMIGHIGGAVNPNGLEIAAGISFFAAGIPLLLGRQGPTRGLIALAGISAVLLAGLRPNGPLWLVLCALPLVIPLPWDNVRSLLRVRAARWWLAGVTVAAVGTGVWSVVMKSTDIGVIPNRRFSLLQLILGEADRWRNYVDQMIAATAWIETRMPQSLYLIWEGCAACLILLAIVYGHRRDRIRMLVLFAGGVGVPSALLIWQANRVGLLTQGRYMLPILVGMVLLAAFILEERGFPAEPARALTRLFALVLLSLHLVVLGYTMLRWQEGLSLQHGLRAFLFHSAWEPAVGTLTPLIVEVVGLVVIGLVVWGATGGSGSRPASVADAAPALALATDAPNGSPPPAGSFATSAAGIDRSPDGTV